MKKAINSERIEGRLYQHNLVVKTVQNQNSANFGKEFISGNLEIAVDEAGLNVIPVHFTYVTETNNSGNKNATFTNLKRIIDGGKTWITDGKDEALKLRVDTALALNDFYVSEGSEDRLVSTKVNEGGFVTIVSELNAKEEERNTFAVDMVITSVIRTEKNEERNIENDFVTVKGAIFNFRNDLLPMEFIVRQEEGMTYFEDLNASQNEPVFTKVWGKINCGSIVNEIKEDSAFGGETVRTYERKIKEWVITGTAVVPYDFGDESILTAEELKAAMQNREVLLADIRKRRDEYNAQKASASTKTSSTSAPIPSTATKSETFNF